MSQTNEFTVDENSVIVEYQNRLANETHQNILLVARVRLLEGELARLQSEQAASRRPRPTATPKQE